MNAQESQVKDTPLKKGLFLSLNARGSGMQGPGKEYFAYFVFYGESGFWINEKVLTGISFGAGYLSNNIGLEQNYTPFEANVFVKYFPFKKKGLRWLGAQTQVGLANSGMEVYDTEKKLFVTAAIGPVINLKIFKTNFGLNAAIMISSNRGTQSPPSYPGSRQTIGVTGYLGLSYTFKRHTSK